MCSPWYAIGCVPLMIQQVVGGVATTASSQLTRVELYRRPLKTGQEIVILRQELTADQRATLLPDAGAAAKLYSVSVALQSGELQVPLACRVLRETDRIDTGFNVLDVVMGSGELILAVGRGVELCLWNIRFGEAATDSWTVLRGWEYTALARQITGNSQKLEFHRLPDGGS